MGVFGWGVAVVVTECDVVVVWVDGVEVDWVSVVDRVVAVLVLLAVIEVRVEVLEMNEVVDKVVALELVVVWDVAVDENVNVRVVVVVVWDRVVVVVRVDDVMVELAVVVGTVAVKVVLPLDEVEVMVLVEVPVVVVKLLVVELLIVIVLVVDADVVVTVP